MKTIITVITMTAVGLVGPASKSQAQTVQDNNSGQVYFEHSAKVLCGSRASISVRPESAYISLSGEYLQNRNLDEVARNLALDGLNAFPDSKFFSVTVQDSKGTGHAEVRR